MKLFRTRKLNQRGVSHLLIPLLVVVLVAVGGVYALVASHADSLNKKTTSTKKGVLVIYSQQGKYQSAKVQLVGTPPKGVNCGGALNANGFVEVKLPALKNGKAAPKKVNCAPVSGTGAYEIFYGASKQASGPQHYDYANGPMVSVDVDAGYCTIVHTDASQIRKVKYDGKKCEDNLDKDEPIQKLNVSMRVLPDKIAAGKKKITGYVDLRVPSWNLQREQCAGSVTITYSNGGATASQVKAPIKYTQSEKWNEGNGYCVAVLNLATSGAGTWKIDASFPGNTYLNSNTATATATVAKAAAANNGNGGTAAPANNGSGGAEAPGN